MNGEAGMGHAAATAIVTHQFVRTHGQGRINLEIARGIAAAGHPVHIIGHEADADFLHHANVHLHLIPRRNLPSDLAKELAFALAASKTLRRLRHEDPRLAVINNGAAVVEPCEVNIAMFVHAAWWRSPMHPRFRRTASAGRLWTAYQTLYTRFNMRAERKAFRSAAVCVGLADLVRDELIQDVGVDTARAVTIMPGVDCDEFRPAEPDETVAFRRSVGASEEKVVALFAGDIRTNRKNLDLVLHTIAQLPPEIELWVAGSTDGSPYPALAERLGIASRVRWLGHRTDMPLVMRSADMFLFPSHYEPFGLVVLEAMASGLPVITTKQTGAADAVRGEAGLVLLDSSDLATLVEGVRSWLTDRDRLAIAKRAARAEALTRTWSAMGEKYLALVRQLAETKVAH